MITVKGKHVSIYYDFIHSVTAENSTVINVCGWMRKFQGKLTFSPPLCLVSIYYSYIDFSNEVEIEYTKVSKEERKKLASTLGQQFFRLDNQPFLAKGGVIFIGPTKDWYPDLTVHPYQEPIYGGNSIPT